jgi:transposase
VPELQPEDVVIWDNLQPHKAAAVVAAVEQAGARVVPLPPSSPDLTPIEEMFSKVKGRCAPRRRGRRWRSLQRSARRCMTFLRRTSWDGSNPVRRMQCKREAL